MLGLGQACRRKARSNEQLGAKSLDRDRDLGDLHTWPHSYYLMRQCDGVGGWVQLKYRLCMCGCGCELCRYKNVKVRNVRVWNQQSDEGRNWRLHPLLSFGSPTPLLSWSPCSPDPYLTPLFYSVLFLLAVCFPEIARYIEPLLLKLDAHPKLRRMRIRC